jgi:TPP-dependent pyruvate/acetoin dehydrogenase alpha subunit
MTGHSAHDDVKYVPKELFAEWEKKDPILKLESSLLRQKVVSEDAVKKLAARITREVDEGLGSRRKGSFPRSGPRH